tara:strand:- start:4704 stop:5612 length:909 start_codon:yes stop_codon:yes gene_type:complete
MKKNLVIGGLGFIGSALVQLLEEKGEEVIITTQSSIENKKANIISAQYNLESFKIILKENEFKDVYFLSGNSYPKNSENNFLLDFTLLNIPFFSLLEAMKELEFKGNCWFASSVAVYGGVVKDIQSETDECFPLSNYGVSKLNAEEYVKYFSRVHQINCGVFRIFSTYGGGLKRQLIYDIYTKIKANPMEINLFGTGNEARDFSYVYDQAEKMVLIANQVAPTGDIFNIGSGKLYTVTDVVTLITNHLKIYPKVNFPNSIRKFDGVHWKANISKLENLGYSGERTFKEGLMKTIADFENKNS